MLEEVPKKIKETRYLPMTASCGLYKRILINKTVIFDIYSIKKRIFGKIYRIMTERRSHYSSVTKFFCNISI